MKVNVLQAVVSAAGIFGYTFLWFKLSEKIFDTIMLLAEEPFIDEDEDEDEEFPVLPIYPDEKPPSYLASLIDAPEEEFEDGV